MKFKLMKKKIKWLIGFCIIALVVTGVFIYKNPHYIYIFGEYIGVNSDEIALTPTQLTNVTQFILDDLKTNDKVTFDQSLMLINTDYPLPDNYSPELSQYKDSELQMNTAVHSAYEELVKAIEGKTKSRLFISSAYRTQQEQENEFEADASTATRPGTSEHQSGLALDVYVQYYAGFGFIKTEAGQFVNSNCWEYGFIIRYPSFGKDKTGIKYEPWHIRYVGMPHAKIIYNNHITLEEYVFSLEDGVWYEVDGYLISRQKLSSNNTLNIIENSSNIVISPDNTGSYIITLKK